jgi:hypothetical protein
MGAESDVPVVARGALLAHQITRYEHRDREN